MDSAAQALLGQILGPAVSILGFIALIIAAILTRRTGKDTVAVSKTTVEISQQSANASEFDIMRQGFVDLVEELRRTVVDNKKDAEEKITLLNERLAGVEEDKGKLVKRVGDLERERGEMLNHMHDLEQTIPYPPGPLPRPFAWGQ